MMRRPAFLTCAFLAVAPLVATAEAVAVPSGQPVEFLDVVQGAPGPSGLTARFRFVAPDINRDFGQPDFEQVSADMAFLCESYAIPRLSNMGPEVQQIIITLMDRPVAFGEANPDATQFFEAYRPENALCIWEGF